MNLPTKEMWIIDIVLDSLATAFTALTTSLVSDILLPPLSVILPLRRNMNEKFAVLRPGPNYNDLDGYNTLDQAQDDGAIVLAYGYDESKLSVAK